MLTHHISSLPSKYRTAVATQNGKHTLDLIWAIMLIYELRPTRYLFYRGADALFCWVNKLLEQPPFIEDFSSSFEKSDTLSRLIDACYYRIYQETMAPKFSLQNRLDYFVSHFGCPHMFASEDFQNPIDETCLLVWLRYLFVATEQMSV